MRPEEVALPKRSKIKYLHKKSFVFLNEEAKKILGNIQITKCENDQKNFLAFHFPTFQF